MVCIFVFNSRKEYIMMTNLIIEVDKGLLDRINEYARQKGQSVSELIEYQLGQLLQNASSKNNKSVSSKLRGIVKLPVDFDYKAELEDRTL